MAIEVIQRAILHFDWNSGLLGILLFFLICVLFWRRRKSQLNFPPGPLGLPYIGNLLALAGEAPHETLMKISNKYGSVFGLKLGVFPVVVLSDYKSIKEAFVKSGDKFSDRPRMVMFDGISKGRGVIGAYHEKGQKEQRRFALSALRSFGMGKRSFEEKITEEIEVFVEHIKNNFSRVAFDPSHIISTSVSNVTCSIIFGRRFDYRDKTFMEMLRIMHRSIELSTNASAMNFLPVLKYVPHTAFAELWKNYLTFKDFQIGIFNEHLKEYDPENPRDFIDIYRTQISKDKSGVTSFDEANMAFVTADLFVAGTETTATTLLWALLYMTLYPDIQQKVQDELDKVVGAGSHPTKEHIQRLPYTEAVLLEIQRMGAIVPLGVPHAASLDTKFHGYDVKKGTIIIANIFAVLRDPDLWEDPNVFDPNRFLDANNQVVRREELIPFSIGRRACLGEQLAKMELYLFFTNLMMRFNFRRPDNAPEPNLRGKTAATRIPHSFEIKATSRVA
ncbi:cytochrome P450 2U1-like [Anneissia japonica]|uniref:cytochrome P450 2U1-like n=1 Tax=Anneissia japonica TaxID=1529436 RepID=UPI001425645A|nr:cytochrome P450 2U1-like [Anneissia japonica]